MLSKQNNIATFWLAPGFRKFEAYEATAGFQKISDSHPFIPEEMHIIEDDETSYYKTTNPCKNQTLHAQPRKVNIDLTQEMENLKQHWSIPVVKLTHDEEGTSDEALLLRYHRNLGYISLLPSRHATNRGYT